MTDTSAISPPLTPKGQGLKVSPGQKPDLRFRGLRVVVALILREMSSTYGRNPGGYLWAVLQPVGMIVILTIAFSFLLRAPSLGTSFPLFYATGFLLLRVFLEVANSVGAAVQFNIAMMAYPRVTFVDTLVARGILAVLTQISVSAVVLTGVFIVDDLSITLDFGPIVEAYLLTILMGVGVGTLNSYLTFSFPVWKTIWGILTRPLFLFSGVFYLYEDLPASAQNVLWYNPMIHMTALMRKGFYPTYDPDFITPIFAAFVGVIPMFFGVLLLKRFCKDAIYK